MQKNRVGLPEDPRTLVLDDFIHVVDTLRFLVPGPVDHTDVRARIVDGLMHHVVLQLSGDGFTAIGMMNRMSGSTEEILEVSGQDTKREVRNLAEIVDHKGQPSVRRRGDWVPVARQRGIEQWCWPSSTPYAPGSPSARRTRCGLMSCANGWCGEPWSRPS